MDDNLRIRFEKLGKIYRLFHQAADGFKSVCRIRCASCCTCNVTLTQLEARFILTSLTNGQKEKLCRKISDFFPRYRYQPKLTMNGFVRHCMEGANSPEEKNDPEWGRCPLLEDDQCSIYPLRPFGCRTLLSEIDCRKTGYARVTELLQTFQSIFTQAIEHLDQGGRFGNLSDIMAAMLDIDSEQNLSGSRLLTNEPVPVWMIPPEHRKKTAGVVRQLVQIIQPHI